MLVVLRKHRKTSQTNGEQYSIATNTTIALPYKKQNKINRKRKERKHNTNELHEK